MGGMHRVIWEIQSEGEGFELDPRMREYFENTIQLTNEQIEFIIETGRKTVNGMSRSDH